MKTCASTIFVPSALRAAAVCAFIFAGCGREGEGREPVAEASAQSVFVSDPVLKAAFEEKRAERKEILSARSKLIARAERMVDEARGKMPGADDASVKAELEKDPEWNSLVQRIETANRAREENRSALTRKVGERIASKRRALK